MAIPGSDIIKDNHLDNAIKSGEELLVVYTKLDEAIVKIAKDLKKISTSTKSAKGIQELNVALSESTKQKKSAIQVDKEKTKLEVKLKALNSDRIQQNEELKVQTQEQAKANKQLARETLGLVGAYEKESKQLIKLRKQLKDLILTEGEGSKKTKQLAKEVQRLDQRLKKADASAGEFGRNVGNYPKFLGKATASLKNFAGALGLLGGIQLVIKGFRDFFGIIQGFDQAQADLASVLGSTRDEMSALTAQSKELGATTEFTASQVAELQKEFAKLGFSQQEIQNVTEATLQLASAAGTDLANAATITGSTLRAFSLDSTETQRVVDVMAKSFSASSLDIDKFKTAMAAVAPVAAAQGVSIERTTALIGTLTDAGIDASTAGTGLRNIFLKLAETGKTFEEAMLQINSASDKTAEALRLFGTRGATLGVVLSNNEESIGRLEQSLINAGGAAETMAETQLDTLNGSLKLLRSAWEGFILGADEAGGVSDKLKGIIKFLADNLDTILTVIINVTKAFVIYRVATFAVTSALKIYNAVQLLATKGMKAFTKATKANPFGLILTALTFLIPLMFDFVDSLSDATDGTEDLTAAERILNEVSSETNVKLVEEQATLKAVFLALKETTAGTEARQKALDQVNAKYGTTLKNLNDEADFVRQVDAAYKSLLATLKEKIRLEIVQEKLTNLLKEQLGFEASLIKQQEALTKKRIELGLTPITITTVDPDTGFLSFEEVFPASFEDDVLEQLIGFSENRIDIIQQQIDALLSSNKDSLDAIFGETTVTTSGRGTRVKKGIKDLIDFSEEEELLQFNARQQRREDNLKQQEDNNRILEENERFHLAEIARINKQQEDDDKKRLDQERKAREDRMKELKKFREDSLSIIKQITADLKGEIDKRIEARETGIEESKTEVARLEVLAAQGNADAAEAIKAEKIKQAQEKLEIEALQKKKKNLLIAVAGLERVSQLIGSGNQNPFATAGGEIKDFLSNLSSLAEGTDYNIGQTLGRAQRSGTDGHLVWADKEEKLLSVKNSRKLKGMHQDEVTRRALAYDNNFVSGKAANMLAIKQMTDVNIVNAVNRNTEAVKNMKQPYVTRDPKTGIETIRIGNKTINNHYDTTVRH